MTQTVASKGDLSKIDVVIHVCDETKNLKQDFTCPRDILIHEMKYFADYLSTDIDKWEDVDISVHCDVQIFDWLMKYVKSRNTADHAGFSPDRPQLEPTNVISILISSDFLKMETLVEECVVYCHDNMSSIVATPCNMNCISDKLVTRISKFFTHSEVESIKDKRDKFRSKLFCKKIEELFDPSFSTTYCPSNASTLFKCLHCEKLLTAEFESYVDCIGSRTSIDNRGNLHYHHAGDSSWDVNDHIISLKSHLKYWRHVFWRLWGTVNYLNCTRCKRYFPGVDFKSCRFHPKAPVFGDENGNSEKRPGVNAVIGKYPCCDDPAMRFDPVQRIQGCSTREHVVWDPELGSDRKFPENGDDAVSKEESSTRHVIEVLEKLKDVICASKRVVEPERPSTPINDEIVRIEPIGSRWSAPARNNFLSFEKKTSSRYRTEIRSPSHKKTNSRAVKRDDEEEDQSELDEPTIVRVVINPAVRPKSHMDDYMGLGTWDTNLPVRLNQDVQREEDLKRMNDLLLFLCKERSDENRSSSASDKGALSTAEFSGGIFHRLECQLKSSLISARPQGSGSTGFSGTTSRNSKFPKS